MTGGQKCSKMAKNRQKMAQKGGPDPPKKGSRGGPGGVRGVWGVPGGSKWTILAQKRGPGPPHPPKKGQKRVKKGQKRNFEAGPPREGPLNILVSGRKMQNFGPHLRA